jgi:thiamine biosynthesis lipoprotein
MGTMVGVDLRDAGAAASDATGAVFAWLRDVDARFSTYREDSEIRRLDRGDLALADCSPAVSHVLGRCDALRAETAGAFDARAQGRLDPSAFVKGWAVEHAARLLEARGVRRFCLNAGGDVRVGRGPAPGTAWHVGIRHPVLADRIAAVVAVEDGAVATSGAYERGTHIVDPRTGRHPAGVRSVTVVGPDLGVADAYSTAAFAMGRDGIGWLAGVPGYAGLAIHDDDTVVATPGFDAVRVRSANACRSRRPEQRAILHAPSGAVRPRARPRRPRRA